MIRMGRSKYEQPSETAQAQENHSNNSNNFYGSGQESNIHSSDSMLNEIKNGRLSGYVGSGTTLNGEMNFQALLRVDGQLTGRITSESGTLIVGSTGRVDANIAVSSAVINGIVNGDIIAAEKIELGRTAQIVGNIQAPRLVMEDGALLEGTCVMLKAKEFFEKQTAANKSQFSADSAPLDVTMQKSETAVS